MALFTFPSLSPFSDSAFSNRLDRIDRLFSQLTGDNSDSLTPPYDLKQVDNEHYSLAVSVPGWKQQELSIEVSGGRLTVTGKREDETDDNENGNNSKGSGWIHRGISRSSFRLSFAVPEHIKPTNAKLEDGLLSVGLHLEIPESEKPRQIPIEHHSSNTIEHQV